MINTKEGSYVIKQLAPCLDLTNEKIIAKYELSEKIAHEFSQHAIPAICALEKSGKYLTLIENTGYLIYPWIEGKTLKPDEISEHEALQIAALSAKIHSTHLNLPEVGPPHFDICSNLQILEAIERAVSCRCPFANELIERKDLIFSMNDLYHSVIPVLREDTVITHGDLDQLNVIWDSANQPFLIDWESARRMNSTREIIRTSLGWSGFGTDHFHLPLYLKMLGTYSRTCSLLNKNHVEAALYAMVGSYVFWMLHNIDLSCMSTHTNEVGTAVKEVNIVLMNFTKLDQLLPELLQSTLALK